MSLLTALALAAQVAPQAATTPPRVVEQSSRAANLPATDGEAAVHQAITAVYAVISGPAGQKRNFAKMRTLFTPDARLYAVSAKGMQGGTLDDYISRSGPFLERVGFQERELARRIDIYGNLAQVWSSYAATSTDGSVNLRGINSFQLARQPDGGWLVHSILWQAETPALPLPRTMEGR